MGVNLSEGVPREYHIKAGTDYTSRLPQLLITSFTPRKAVMLVFIDDIKAVSLWFGQSLKSMQRMSHWCQKGKHIPSDSIIHSNTAAIFHCPLTKNNWCNELYLTHFCHKLHSPNSSICTCLKINPALFFCRFGSVKVGVCEKSAAGCILPSGDS